MLDWILVIVHSVAFAEIVKGLEALFFGFLGL